MTQSVYVEGVGIIGPGLSGWAATKSVLCGDAPYQEAPIAIPVADWLPAAERRRTGTSVKVALAVGREALQHASRDPKTMATVFASSGGDGDNVHAICETLATEMREISPTRFHNSVHNAPSGYWGIASGSMAFSTSLCAYDASFSAGLLEAIAFAHAEAQPVTLIAYDTPYPEPLHSEHTIAGVFGVALVLNVQREANSIARINVTSTISQTIEHDLPEPLAILCEGVPAGRALPLLRALAKHAESVCTVSYLDERALRLAIQPC